MTKPVLPKRAASKEAGHKFWVSQKQSLRVPPAQPHDCHTGLGSAARTAGYPDGLPPLTFRVLHREERLAKASRAEAVTVSLLQWLNSLLPRGVELRIAVPALGGNIEKIFTPQTLRRYVQMRNELRRVAR